MCNYCHTHAEARQRYAPGPYVAKDTYDSVVRHACELANTVAALTVETTQLKTREAVLSKQNREFVAIVTALKNINKNLEYEIMDLRKQVHTLKQNALTARLIVIRVTEELNKAAATYGKPLV